MRFEEKVWALNRWGYKVAIDNGEFVYRDENNELHRLAIDDKLKREIKKVYDKEVKNGIYEKMAEKIVADASKKVLVEIVEEIGKQYVVSIKGDKFTFLTPRDEWIVPIDEVVENAISKLYNSKMTDKDYDEMCETIVKHQYEEHKDELDEMDAKIDKIMQEHYNKVHSEKKGN